MILCIREIAASLEFLEVTVGSYAAFLQYDDAVTLLDSAQTMGNDDARTIQLSQVLNDDVLTDVVECRCGLVEEEHFGFSH